MRAWHERSAVWQLVAFKNHRFLEKIIKGTALDPNWSNDCISLQGGRGQWAVYYTSSKNFYNNVFKFVTLGTFIDFWLVGSFSLAAKRFNPPIVYYKRGNFVYHHWIYTSIYRPLSYPFRSLIFGSVIKKWALYIFTRYNL